MRRLFLRTRILVLSAISGGGLLVLSGCDPTVRDTVLGGVEAATTTLITTGVQAFFESILSDNNDDVVTTVKAVVDHATCLVA